MTFPWMVRYFAPIGEVFVFMLIIQIVLKAMQSDIVFIDVYMGVTMVFASGIGLLINDYYKNKVA